MIFQEEALFTDTYSNVRDLPLKDDAAYVFATSDEDRSVLANEWKTKYPNVAFVPIADQDDLQQRIAVESPTKSHYYLRMDSDRERLLNDIGRDHMYLDITGLNHATWAPIVKQCLQSKNGITVVYQEPESYRARRGTELTRFDLSVGRMLASLPGFERYEPLPTSMVTGNVDRTGRLLVLMGFEGDRFGFILNNQHFDHERVVPVVGVPGFRVEFVAHALLGNERPIKQIEGQARLRYAPAYCPFSLAYTIEAMLSEDRTGTLTIAPIGTKPHALGAVLAALAAPERIEIIYDHPTRNVGRSQGQGRTFAYDVGEFLSQWSLPHRTDITRLNP